MEAPLRDRFPAVPRPVVAMATNYPAGHEIAMHRHRRAQLVYAPAGVMTVTTADGAWVVPPQRAVWVPAGTPHSIRPTGALAMRSLYFSRAAAAGLPEACCVVTVSPLLRELILAAMAIPAHYDPRGPDGRLVAVLLDQIRALPVAPFHLPLPTDPRLRRVTEGLLADPADGRSLEGWGRHAGASARTLARLFGRETGLTFRAWRQQVRLLGALERLAEGQAVTTVAWEMGYESPSAFVAMFRRALGTTPARYFENAARPADHGAATAGRRSA